MKSKNKGNTFELCILRYFKNKGYIVERISGSGNLKDDAGDLRVGNMIGMPIISWKYLIECKHHKEIYPSDLKNWWNTLVLEAEAQGLIPVLITRENYKRIMVRTHVKGASGPIIAESDFQSWLGVDTN